MTLHLLHLPHTREHYYIKNIIKEKISPYHCYLFICTLDSNKCNKCNITKRGIIT